MKNNFFLWGKTQTASDIRDLYGFYEIEQTILYSLICSQSYNETENIPFQKMLLFHIFRRTALFFGGGVNLLFSTEYPGICVTYVHSVARFVVFQSCSLFIWVSLLFFNKSSVRRLNYPVSLYRRAFISWHSNLISSWNCVCVPIASHASGIWLGFPCFVCTLGAVSLQ